MKNKYFKSGAYGVRYKQDNLINFPSLIERYM